MKTFHLLGIVVLIFRLTLISTEEDHFENVFSSENDLNSFEDKRPSVLNDVKTGPCNIPIEHDPISQEDFIQKYAYTSPVIFRRSSLQKERNNLFKDKCDLNNLKNEHGDKKIVVSSANTYSYGRYTMKLSDYLEKYVKSKTDEDHDIEKLKYGNETWYFFGEHNVSEWKSLFDLYERPAYTLPSHDYAYSFGIAAAFTGNLYINK